jgi:hypothetical protein
MSPQTETAELVSGLRKMEAEVKALRSALRMTTLLLGGTVLLLLAVVLTPLGMWVQNHLPWGTQKSTTVTAEEFVAKRFIVRDGENELANLGVGQTKWGRPDRAALYIYDHKDNRFFAVFGYEGTPRYEQPVLSFWRLQPDFQNQDRYPRPDAAGRMP